MRVERQILNFIDTPLAFKKDANGMIRQSARIGREGIHVYINERGEEIKELIPEKELKQADFSDQIVTLDHPPEFLTTSNSQMYQKGFTGEIPFKNGWLEGNVVITSQNAIEAAESGHFYFSTGYYAQLNETPGIWVDKNGVMGEKGKEYEYDAIQEDIVPNHVALVKQPRAGKLSTFINSKTGKINIEYSHNPTKDKIKMQLIHNEAIYNIEGEDAGKVVNLFKEMKNQLASYENLSAKSKEDETKVNSLTAQVTTLTKEKETLEGQNTVLTKELETQKAKKLNEDQLSALVTEKIQVWETVQNSLEPDDINLSCLDLKKKYLCLVYPELQEKINSGSEDVINGMWMVNPSVKAPNKNIQTENNLTTQTAKAAAKQNTGDPESRESLEAEYQKALANYHSTN